MKKAAYAAITAIVLMFLLKQLDGIKDADIQVGLCLLAIGLDVALCLVAKAILEPPVDTHRSLLYKSGLREPTDLERRTY